MSYEIETDPEFWKVRIGYSDLWEPHMKKVFKLKDKILQRFPEVKFPELGIKFGLGADTSELLKIPPEQKGEADLKIFYDYQNVCDIEVTGSDRVFMANPILWVRPDKFAVAESEDHETWFYLEYPNITSGNNVWVLDKSSIKPHEKNIIFPRLRPDPITGEMKQEKYIAIPNIKGMNESIMFDWIESKIKQIISE